MYVFEPEEEGFQAINRNVALNGLGENVKPIQAAISNYNGKITYYIRPNKDTHSLFRETGREPQPGIQYEYEVDVHTIDTLFEEEVIRQPNFIKMDIEGNELNALEGMRKILANTRAIYIECHPVPNAGLGMDADEATRIVSEKLKDVGARRVIQFDEDHIVGLFQSEDCAGHPEREI